VKVALVDVARTGNPVKMCPGHYHDYIGHLGGKAEPGKVMFGEGECRGCKANGPHPQRDLGWPQDQYLGEKTKRRTAVRKQAHDSGDGATIFHCPFCGSGQVIARSDRTTECEYCHTCFTVQVQPQFPAFPQTINGMPMQVPGMPGEIGGPPAAPGQDPMDPMGGNPMGGGDPGEDGGFPPGEDDDGGDEEPEGDDGGDDAPPFAKGSMLRTASGASLEYENYLRHLAIKFADNKDDVIERVREGR
jgi:hypothetical protein